MYNPNQAREEYDPTQVATLFTQGLRALPTDAGTRVRHFLTEYLGRSAHPVPFGGRDQHFAQLDHWLLRPGQTPYLLLAAPAGRGKSALLVRWCLRYLSNPDLAIAYFPVSIRFRTNLAGVAFPALVALFASLHNEKVPNDPNLSEEVWLGLLMSYLRRPLPANRTLLLVLDGVDEAADWSVGSDLFPQEPPTGLRVLLSARYLANDQGPGDWLERLHWSRPGLASTMALHPLDASGVANVLYQMGFPLDVLGRRVNIVSELYRLSEGDPLLVRLYIDELWARGEEAVRLRPEDLSRLQPGLAGYFERWWREQRLLWQEQHVRSESLTQHLLNLLAGALGPLSLADLQHLLGDEFTGPAQELSHYLSPLARFVTGDGVHQGYVFSHPRLGNYFLEERMSVQERQEVAQRFLIWGRQTLAALDMGTLAPEAASSYIVQYYGAHLEQAGGQTSDLLALVSDGWRRAWEKLDRANAGFLGDVARAWRAAEHEDFAASQQDLPAPYLGDEIRCLLSQASVNSVTSSIPPKLMLAAVRTGVWTPAQGLASLRLISDLAPRALELVGLAPYVPEPQRSEILQEALDTVLDLPDSYARLDALIALAPGLSESLLWHVLEMVPAIEDEADQAGILAELIPALATYPALVARSLEILDLIVEDEYRSLALTGLLPYLDTPYDKRIIEAIEAFADERAQAQVLQSLIERNPTPDMVLRILPLARNLRDDLARLRLLASLLATLPEPVQTETLEQVLELVRVLDDREYRVEALLQIATYLSQAQLKAALDEVESLWDEALRVRALRALLPLLPDQWLSEILHSALQLKSEELRVQILLPLLPRFREEHLELILENVPALWDERWRVEVLAQLSPLLTDGIQSRFQACVTTIHDPGYRAWLVAECPRIGQLPNFDLTSLFHSMYARDERFQTLLAITPLLTSEAQGRIFSTMLPEIFGMNWRFQSDEQSAHLLGKLGPYLPEFWLPQALEVVRVMKNPVSQCQVLLALAPRVTQALLLPMLDIVRGMADRGRRAQVLEALVSSSPEEYQRERIQEMFQILQVVKDEGTRVQLLSAYAQFLPEQDLSPRQTWLILMAVGETQQPIDQCLILQSFLGCWPREQLVTLLPILHTILAQQTQGDLVLDLSTSLLQKIAPLLPSQHFSSLLALALEIRHPHWREQVLTNILTYAPESDLIGLFERLQMVTDEDEYTLMLSVLAPHIPRRFFMQLWEDTWTVSEPARMIQILGALALRMPEEFFSHFWRTFQSIADPGRQLWVLRILAPHMTETLFEQLFQATLKIRSTERRGQFLTVLVPHAPERFFAQLWEAGQKLSEEHQRQVLFEALAAHVPAEQFLDFFTAAIRLEDRFARFQILNVLLHHVPDQHFLIVWQTVYSTATMSEQQRWFGALIAHLPLEHFATVWQTLEGPHYVDLRLLLLKTHLSSLSEQVPAEWLITLFKEIGSPGQRLTALELLAPQLVPETALELLYLLLSGQGPSAINAEFRNGHRELRALVTLTPYLPVAKIAELFPILLTISLETNSEVEQAWLLAQLAGNVPEESLERFMAAIWSLSTASARDNVLRRLLPSLSQTGWQRVLASYTQASGQPERLERLLQILRVAGPDIAHCPRHLLYPALREILHYFARQNRGECIQQLLHLTAPLLHVGGEQALLSASLASLEVGLWWP